MDTWYFTKRLDGFMVDAGCPLDGGDPSICRPKYGTRDGRYGSSHRTSESHTDDHIQSQYGAAVCDIDRGYCLHCSPRGGGYRCRSGTFTMERLDRGSAVHVRNHFTDAMLDYRNNDHPVGF